MKHIYIQLKSKRSIQQHVAGVVIKDYLLFNFSCENIGEKLCKGPPGRTRSPGKALAWAGQTSVFSNDTERFEGEFKPSSIELFARRKHKASMNQNIKAIKKTKINSSILNF